MALAMQAAVPAPLVAQEPEAPRELPVGTCMNIGNVLEIPRAHGLPKERDVSTEDFERIRAAGFESIRLPVRWHERSSESPPYTIDPEWLDRVQLAVDQALASDLKVILNSHHFDPIYERPLEVADWHGGVWKQIAERFADYPEDRLWFELENEPHDQFTSENLWAVLTPAYDAVRASNPTRAIIIGGGNWSDIDSLETLTLPDDPNLYPTFHYYAPMEFTHQGATWVPPEKRTPAGRTLNADDITLIEGHARKVAAYIERTGLVPLLGETGAIAETMPLEQRVKYHTAVADAFGKVGVDSCMWAYANTFPFWDRNTGRWNPGLLSAVGLQEPAAATVTDAPTTDHLPEDLLGLSTQLPGTLANDPRSLAWNQVGTGFKSKPVVDESIPGGGAAIRFSVKNDSGEPHEAMLQIPLLAGIETGQMVTLGFWARALSSADASGQARMNVRFQQSVAPWQGYGDRALSIGTDWQWIEVPAKATMSIAKGEAVASLQLGGLKQEVEIGQAIAVIGAASIVK